MIEIAVAIGVIACAGAAAVGLVVLNGMRADLRRVEEQSAARHTAMVTALATGIDPGDAAALQEVRGSVGEAVVALQQATASFEAMVFALHDVENLHQIRDAILELSVRLQDNHDRLGEQTARTGEIIERLHELVTAWSEGHSELELAWQRLAGAVEAAVTVDAARREELLAALRAATAGGGDARR